jgi:trehalose 6-phosphate synthase/phosphatase
MLNHSGRVISAASNIPYIISYPDWALKPRRRHSALFDSFSYLASTASQWDHALVGWTGEISSTLSSSQGLRITLEDRERLEKQLESTDRGRIVPVWLPDEIAKRDHVFKNQGRWRRYAEMEIYGLFHHKHSEPADGPTIKKAWADYDQMNKLFADRIIEAYNPGDVIIVHDYNLLLLPSLLRQRLPRAYIAFFLHIPFPSSEFFRCIGHRKELLEGILGANMIGFQSLSYCSHFSACCTKVLGLDALPTSVELYGARVAVEAFPIGINAAAIQQAAFHSAAVHAKILNIRQSFAGKKIILGRDRLDTLRSVTRKLQAFELFLERYPEWRDKAVLILITTPSEITEIRKEESKCLNKIPDLASKINGLYGSLSFTPVQHFQQYLAKDEYFALLQVADVALITSVREGMNTASLEFILCQKYSHSPLILSEFSASSIHLAGAIHVNPWDLGAVANGINDALCMSPEARQERHEQLYPQVVSNNIQVWTDTYIKRLLANLEANDHCFCSPVLDRNKLFGQYHLAGKRLFMFDYDGTLTPIVKDPSAAIPTDRVLRTLKTLASDSKNAIWIVSGRDQVFLEKWLGHIPELGLSAEHGCFIRRPYETKWKNIAEQTGMGWQEDITQIFQRYTEKTAGP